MKRLITVLLMLCFTAVTWGQKYKTGGDSQAYRIIETDTVFANKTLYDNIKNMPDFSITAKIMELTGAQEELNTLGMCTVFLPSNQAFSALDEDALKALLSPANAQRLKDAFMSHVVTGRVDANSYARMAAANQGSAIFRSPGAIDPELTVAGTTAYLSVPNAPKATITATNYFHAQGYLHIVDGFLLPEPNN